jgi:hypothetical protein
MSYWSACNLFRGRLPQRRQAGGAGIYNPGSDSALVRSGYKTLRHANGGNE